MRHITHYISGLAKKLNWEALLFAVVLLVLLTNTKYVMYPDEFVNMLGGKFILMGKIPYKDFFDHHLPFAWYLAAFLELFSFGSYVVFRFWWAVFIFLTLLGTALYIRKTKSTAYPYYLFYLFLYPFITVYYWTHLFLSDSLAFLFFSVLFWVLLVETFQKHTRDRVIYILTVINFILIFSSLTFIYIAGFFYLWMLYLFIRGKWDWKRVFKLIGISLVPFVIYGLYLLVTNSWKEFYIANVVYNTTLYIDIPNYTKGHLFNPIKFGLTIIFNFYEKYIPLLVRIKEFNLYFPVDLTLALGSFILLLFLFLEDKIVFVLFFLILSFSAPRSNIMRMGETDYQSGLFIALGFCSTLAVLWRYKHIELKDEILGLFKKVLVILLLFYLVFGSLFLIKNTYDKYYQRYTQKMPGIYDVAYSASFINSIVDKNDYYWIGPYEPNEEYFVKAKLPGKFPSLLPQFREDRYFSNQFLAQFENHPPKIIVYKHEASIFMTPAMEFGAFFVGWMKGKYTSIENLKQVQSANGPTSFNIRTDLYIRNENVPEILDRLRSSGNITLK